MRLLALLAVFALVAGCGKPTSTVIPSDISAWDKELAPAMQKLSEQDRQLAAAYLVRAKLGEAFGGNGMPPGTTIGDALENQKRGWRSAKRLMLKRARWRSE